MRPIEVGDYVLAGYRWGYVAKLSQNPCVERARIEYGEYWDIVKISDIKTIRNPRPGGKEERDIVKISAQYYKAIKNKRFRHLVFWGMSRENATISSIEFAKKTDVWDIYQEQKQMLKVQS
jgi:hypothetical protein